MENPVMNLTARIKACEGHVQYNSIHKIVGCSPQLVYYALRDNADDHKYVKIKETPKPVKREPYKEIVYQKDMNVIVSGDPLPWEVKTVGNCFVSLKRAHDNLTVTKDKIVRVLSA